VSVTLGGGSGREPRPRVGILFRGDRRAGLPAPHALYDPLARAFEEHGVAPAPVLYDDEAVAEVREELLRLGAVLVWVDPIAQGKDRARLDELLREVAARGVWVSTHPDVILAMGTKEVLYRTRTLGWGTDTRLYATFAQLEEELPLTLGEGRPRVLKQNRGNGGLGVFRVELLRPDPKPPWDARVRVQHAQRGSAREETSLGDFVGRCASFYAGSGRIVDQPLVPRHADGMVRCYLVHGRVAGFGRQRVTALMDPLPGEPAPPLPEPRRYYGPAVPELQALKAQLEAEWIPEMQALLAIDGDRLPALWDADFLLGPKTAAGLDRYVLCETNVSSVFPFPAEAREPLVRAVAARLRGGGR
jgi:hypothetical protein